MPKSTGKGRIIIFEDNEAVIKMIIKMRSPALKHVARTHRVNLDWLFERLQQDPSLFVRYIGTKEQIADLFTKGNSLPNNGKTYVALPKLDNLKIWRHQYHQ